MDEAGRASLPSKEYGAARYDISERSGGPSVDFARVHPYQRGRNDGWIVAALIDQNDNRCYDGTRGNASS